MIERSYSYTATDEKLIEKVAADNNIAINHIILAKGDSLPEHFSSSNVYMIILRGSITLNLDVQEQHEYPARSVINIPYNTKMNVSNQRDEVLEFLVIKS